MELLSKKISCRYFHINDKNPLIENFVWLKGTKMVYYHQNVLKQLRRDVFGNIMEFCQFNNQNDEYGWTIDHCLSLSYCYRNNISIEKYHSFINLQPMSFKSLREWKHFMIKIINGKKIDKLIFLENDNQYVIRSYKDLGKILKDDHLYFSKQYP